MEQLLSIEDWVLQYRSQDIIDYVNEKLELVHENVNIRKLDISYNWNNVNSDWISNCPFPTYKYRKDYLVYCINTFLIDSIVLINMERNYIYVINNNTTYKYNILKTSSYYMLEYNFADKELINNRYSKWLPRITSSETFINLLDLINSNAIECKTNYDFIKLLNNL